MIDDIPLETQRRWLRHLTDMWSRVNEEYLSGRLRRPQFALDDATSRLGSWDSLTRTIGLSIDHMAVASWWEIEMTLRHEMAHQVVSELFDANGVRPHGDLFATACQMVQIPPDVRGERSEEHQKVRARIQKLMALSQSSNPHEAQAAMAAANRLLLKHNIDLRDSETDSDYEYRMIGKAVGQISMERRILGTILSRHFFVECVWVRTTRARDGKRAALLEVFGTSENLDLAEYVHGYLNRTLDGLWKDFRKKHPRHSGRAARNEFRIGVLMGFLEHLDSQQESNVAEGLVWTGDPRITELKGNRHPSLRSMRSGRYRAGAAHNLGRKQGKGLRIRPGVKGPTERGFQLT